MTSIHSSITFWKFSVCIYDRIQSIAYTFAGRCGFRKWIRTWGSPNAHLSIVGYTPVIWRLHAVPSYRRRSSTGADNAAAGRTDRIPTVRPVCQPVRQPQSVLWTCFCLRPEPHRAVFLYSSIFAYLNADVKSLPPAQRRLPCLSTAYRSSPSQ